MVARKSDADQIRRFVADLAKETWLRYTERNWWPKFVFHYTDLENVVKILQDRYLYNRRYLEQNQQLIVDSASQDVLATTDDTIKEHVRLYFRPLTPTQWHSEGIQSNNTLAQAKFPEAHCPIPVFFLFDSAEILTRRDCEFSDGNLGSFGASRFSTAQELMELPWQKIYHTVSISPSQKTDIVHRRCAEIIVPDKLELSSLRYIYCRSVAEKETLLHLMSPQLRKQYQGKVVATTRSMLFYRRHTFVESVSLSSGSVNIRFSPDTSSPGPFVLRVEVVNKINNTTYRKENNILAKGRMVFDLPKTITRYSIRFRLDEHLVYSNDYEEKEIPF